MFEILAINPGSISTKVAVFEDERAVLTEKISHSSEEMGFFDGVIDQFSFRRDLICKILSQKGFNLSKIHAVVGRGGLLRPIEGGTYCVDEEMLEDLESCKYGEHASNLGGIIAYAIGQELGVPSFVVDPVVVDEMVAMAKFTGFPQIERRSVFHALNQKAIARRSAAELGKDYETSNFIVAHLGGGITVGAHRKGKVIDVVNGLDGEGPFSPERSGKLPVAEVAKMCFSGNYSWEEIRKMIVGDGGMMAHLGTKDAREIRRFLEEGDERAGLLFEAMAYQVAREIGACAATLAGEVDAIAITGGLAYDQGFVEWIKQRVSFIAQVLVFPGEDELLALAQGALRVLKGTEEPKRYGKGFGDTEIAS